MRKLRSTDLYGNTMAMSSNGLMGTKTYFNNVEWNEDESETHANIKRKAINMNTLVTNINKYKGQDVSGIGLNKRYSVKHNLKRGIDKNNEGSIKNLSKSPNFDFYKFNETCVLVTMVHPSSLYFSGVLKVKVLIGSINVLGYTLNRLSEEQTLFSPNVCSSLSISTKNRGELDETVIRELKELGINNDKIYYLISKFHKRLVMLIVSEEKSNLTMIMPNLIKTCIGVNLLPNISLSPTACEEEKAVKCAFHVNPNGKKLFKKLPEWKHIFDSRIKQSVMAVYHPNSFHQFYELALSGSPPLLYPYDSVPSTLEHRSDKPKLVFWAGGDDARLTVERSIHIYFFLKQNSLGWRDYFYLRGCSKTIICGGKDVGKSTLMRFLINRSLAFYKKVLVLDFDPGQTEFTVPGCISAILVTTPLLGPNFTHLLTPLRCIFIGCVDVVVIWKQYLSCSQDLINFCNASEDLKNIPWFVNTMGFTKGIGLPIMASLIKEVFPTNVIQIESNHELFNYTAKLTPEFVKQNVFHTLKEKKCSTPFNYELFVLPSIWNNYSKALIGKPKSVITGGLAPRDLRNIMIMFYFGQMLNPEVSDIRTVEPYTISIADIKITAINKHLTETVPLDAVNGSLVGLCHTSNGTQICLGFGIVKDINKKAQQLLVVTPLSEAEFSEVNNIVKGSIQLPDNFFSDPSQKIINHVSGKTNDKCKKFKNKLMY